MLTVLSFLAALLIRLLRLSWRVRVTGPDPGYSGGPLVFCFWHGRQAGLFAHPRPRPVAVLSSLSRDGSLQAGILARLGFVVKRGSSSRGGAAGLKGLIGALEGGADGAFAVDGPRGPARVAKPGAVEAARKAGGSLVPITTRASRSWRFRDAWDDYLLPRPFARVEIIRGEQIPVGDEDTDGVLEKLQTALGQLEAGE